MERELNNQRRARLDRFLVTEDWYAHFRGVGQSLLQRPVSDHFPILLEGGGGLVRGPLLFRFENMWIRDESFKDLIKDWWRNMRFNGTRSYIILEKLKALKSRIKIWNREVFGKVEDSKKAALARVDFWDEMEGQRTLSSEELEEKVRAKSD